MFRPQTAVDPLVIRELLALQHNSFSLGEYGDVGVSKAFFEHFLKTRPPVCSGFRWRPVIILLVSRTSHLCGLC